MAIPPTLPINHAPGNVVASADINDIAVGINRAHVGVFNVLNYGAVGDGTTNDRPAIQSAITAAAGNGKVYFPPGKTYYLNSVGPLLLESAYTNLILDGYGATIKLGTSAKSFLSFNRTTDNQVFQNITVQGFRVDGNALTATGADTHVVIGTLDTSGLNMSFQNILIQDIYSFNNLTDTASPTRTNGRYHVAFYTASNGSGTAAGNLLENITVRRCTFLGGVLGAMVTTATINGLAVINRPVFQDLWHDTLVPPTAFAAMSNFHIGFCGRVRNAVIQRCYGFNSWDDGIEVNNADPTIIVEDCYVANSWNPGYSLTNYSTPTRNDLSIVTWRNCHYLVSTVNSTNSGGWFVGSTGTNDHNEMQIIGCSSIDARSFIRPDYSYAGINVSGTSVLKRLVIRDFSCAHSGFTWNPGSAAQVFEGLNNIVLNGTSPVLIIDGMRMLVRGTQTTAGAPNAVFMYPLKIAPQSATARVDIQNIEAEFALVNTYASGHVAAVVRLGVDGTGFLLRTASIRGLKLRASTDVAPEGVAIGASTVLTISDKVILSDFDFSGVDATNMMLSGDATNKAKTFIPTLTVLP